MGRVPLNEFVSFHFRWVLRVRCLVKSGGRAKVMRGTYLILLEYLKNVDRAFKITSLQKVMFRIH